MSVAVTQGVRIEVEAEYNEAESFPDEERFLFVYHVTIANDGEDAVQLLSRRWVITNSNGQEQIVEGPGVIGKQPVLKPGEVFNYSSFCPLTTPLGTMHGYYVMVDEEGEEFRAKIAPFRLAVPDILH